MAIFKNLIVDCSSQELLQWDETPVDAERRVWDPEDEHPWEQQDVGIPLVLLQHLRGRAASLWLLRS